MIRSWPCLVIGLVIPAVAILGGIAVIGPLSWTLFGIPAVFSWMFLCFPLTSLCLWISWHFYDRHDHHVEETQR